MKKTLPGKIFENYHQRITDEERDDIKNEEGEAERNYPESENTEQSLSDINANEVIDDLSTSEEEIDEN